MPPFAQFLAVKNLDICMSHLRDRSAQFEHNCLISFNIIVDSIGVSFFNNKSVWNKPVSDDRHNRFYFLIFCPVRFADLLIKFFAVGQVMSIRNGLWLACLLATSMAHANYIDIQELALFTVDDSGVVMEQNEINPLGSYSDFPGSGLDVVFSNDLDADNFGSFSWTITNNSTQAYNGFTSSVFWDADIARYDNSLTNETGQNLGGLTADYWEIDEPGYGNGDLFWNMLDFGRGDNSNGQGSTEDDVAFSLGFELEEFGIGDVVTLTFEVSQTDTDGLYHYDPDSDWGYFFNGFMDYVSAVPVSFPDPNDVSEPGTLALALIGLLGLLASRRRQLTF